MIMAMCTGSSWKRSCSDIHSNQSKTLYLQQTAQPKKKRERNQQKHKLPSYLQVPLDLSDIVLQQELVLQGETTVLVIQLSQEVVESDPRQRVLHRHCFPAAPQHQQPGRSAKHLQVIPYFAVFLPVDALDPPAQVLTDVHGERVIVELVHLLQVLTVQHLELTPL